MIRVIRYLVAGGLTTLVNFGLYTMFTRALMWDVNFSNVLAVAASVVFAYIVNKLFVFESRTATPAELLRECLSFFGARGFTIGLDIGGLYLFHTVLGLNDLIVKVTINVAVVILNYVISKFLVFKKSAST